MLASVVYKKNKAALGVLVLLLFATPQTIASVVFTVTASVVASCNISTTDINFGSYSLAQVDTTSTITVTCTTGSIVKIGLDAGTAPGATVTTRKMTSGTNTLAYGLYRDSARMNNWGNTLGVDSVDTSGAGVAQVFLVYGRIPAGQTSPIGSYSDTIIAKVTFQ